MFLFFFQYLCNRVFVTTVTEPHVEKGQTKHLQLCCLYIIAGNINVSCMFEMDEFINLLFYLIFFFILNTSTTDDF